MNQLIIVTVKATGKKIQVYKLKSGGYCDYEDCKTTYLENELKF